jgi:hypothetical protein
MGFLTSKVGYTSATTGRGDHEVHKGHVVALKKLLLLSAVELSLGGSNLYNNRDKTNKYKYI